MSVLWEHLAQSYVAPVNAVKLASFPGAGMIVSFGPSSVFPRCSSVSAARWPAWPPPRRPQFSLTEQKVQGLRPVARAGTGQADNLAGHPPSCPRTVHASPGPRRREAARPPAPRCGSMTCVPRVLPPRRSVWNRAGRHARGRTTSCWHSPLASARNRRSPVIGRQRNGIFTAYSCHRNLPPVDWWDGTEEAWWL